MKLRTQKYWLLQLGPNPSSLSIWLLQKYSDMRGGGAVPSAVCMHQRQLTEIPREVLLRIPAESEGSDAGLVTPLLSIPHLHREKQPTSMPPSSQGPGWGPRGALRWCWHHWVTWSVQGTGLLRIHSHSDVRLATLLSTSLGPSSTGADAGGHTCENSCT